MHGQIILDNSVRKRTGIIFVTRYISTFYYFGTEFVYNLAYKIIQHIMDREIPKEERLRSTSLRLIKIIGGVVVATALVVVLISMLRSTVNRKDIVVAEANIGEIDATISASGKVVPAFEEIITSPIGTRIVEVYCKAGDSVDINTPLLKLDLQSTESEVRKLEDQRRIKEYEGAQKNLNDHTYLSNLEMQLEVKAMNVNRLEAEAANERYLDSLGSGTGDRVRQAELAYQTAKLELSQLQQQLMNERQVRDAGAKVAQLDINVFDRNLEEMRRTLQDAQVLSPRKATLTFIVNEIGKRVGAGEQLAIISDLEHFKIDAEIADAYGELVGPGARVVVRIGRENLEGTISNITPQSKNGVIAFSIQLKEDSHSRLRSGLKTDVYVARCYRGCRKDTQRHLLYRSRCL